MQPHRFNLQNRRYLGNKFKLLDFIYNVIRNNCGSFGVLCEIFAGTGVLSQMYKRKNISVIANDILKSNYVPLKAFLETSDYDHIQLSDKILFLNHLDANEDNYFSQHYGGTFFTISNAKRIGVIRETIDKISDNSTEQYLLLTSLLYAVDKVANTVGHYDAFRKKLDSVNPIWLYEPNIACEFNINNKVYNEDANQLIRNIECDVLYIDPPYNSRQYSDAYHLLENLITWEKPVVHGKAKKMDRSHIKSAYCLRNAPDAFCDLILNAKCKHIIVSYNNTQNSKHGRSNARISDEHITSILGSRGKLKIYESKYKEFTTGRSHNKGNIERLFYCNVVY